MKKVLPTPQRTRIFAPAKSMPKAIKDAAIILGAPDATPEDIRRAAETLRADGQVRGEGAHLDDVRASAVELVGEIYACLRRATTSPKEASRLASLRLLHALNGSGAPGSASASSGGSTQRIR